jgi:hypothetical protein
MKTYGLLNQKGYGRSKTCERVYMQLICFRLGFACIYYLDDKETCVKQVLKDEVEFCIEYHKTRQV